MMTPEKYLKEQFDRLVENEVMYADTINGKFDMTREDLISQIKANPTFTNPEEIAFVDSDGVEYTGYDALEMAGVENELEEKKLTQAEIEDSEDEDEVEKIQRPQGSIRKDEVYESIQYGDKFLSNTERWLQENIVEDKKVSQDDAEFLANFTKMFFNMSLAGTSPMIKSFYNDIDKARRVAWNIVFGDTSHWKVDRNYNVNYVD